jgi:erythromycin esterase-like protein
MDGDILLTRRAVAAAVLFPFPWWESPSVPPHLPSWLTDREDMLVRQIVQNREGTDIEEMHRAKFEPLRTVCGGAEIVLLGEATHGTQEFYQLRADITRYLIEHDHFDAVACEGDHPLFEDLNRFVAGEEGALQGTVQDAFDSFPDRFPAWLWRNDAFAGFISWLAKFNASRATAPVQLLGLDIYSLYPSMDQVIRYLENDQLNGGSKHDSLAQDVRDLYAPLDHFRPEPTDYGKEVFYGSMAPQASNVAQVVRKLQSAIEGVTCSKHNPTSVLDLCNALESARVVAASEAYYRLLPETRERRKDYTTLWNLREAAMFRALQSLRARLQRRKQKQSSLPSCPPKIIVWAHNSHVGDVRATQRAYKSPQNGGGPSLLVSLGQLCRQVFGRTKVYSIGFTSNTGTVRAARAWGEPDLALQLQPAVEGSHEHLLGTLSKLLRRNVVGYCFRSLGDRDGERVVEGSTRELFAVPRIQRLVGATYSADTELRSHYETAVLSQEFDYVFHVDRSTAVRVDEVSKWKWGSVRNGEGDNESHRRPMYLLNAFGKD